MKRKKTATTSVGDVAEQNTHELKWAREMARFAGEPTYTFAVGDKVSVGALEDATVDEVVDNGAVYGIAYKSYDRNKETYNNERRYFAWTNVRPIVSMPSVTFTRSDKIDLHFTNRSIESLISMHLHLGVDFAPEYQRDRVWDAKDQELLLDSIFMGADIGKFVFRHRSTEEWLQDNVSYEIVDGKQRLLTLLDYYENRFAYKGVYYNDLHPRDKITFENASVTVAEIECFDKTQVLKVFLMVNRGGRPVSDEVIRKAEKLLAEAES